MAPLHFLAVDLGAESGRVVALRLDGRRSGLDVLHRFENRALNLDGRLVWNLNHLWSSILEGLKKAAQLAPAPLSVGVDSWAVDYVLLDKNDLPLRPAYSYRDPRPDTIRQGLVQRLGNQALYARTGLQPHVFNTLFQLANHAQRHADDFERASSLLLIPDYLNFKLCGTKAAEWTNASTTGLCSPAQRHWDLDLAVETGLPPRLLPALSEPGRVLGSLSPDLEQHTGLRGLKVLLPATHDTASAVVAVPAKGEDWAYISSGTWSLMGMEVPGPVTTPEAFEAGLSNEGGAENRTRLLKNIMGLWLIQRLRSELAPGTDYAALTLLSQEAKALEFLFDAADPSLLNPPSMAAALRQKSGAETLPQLLRASFESLALEYRWTLEQLRRITGRAVSTIHIVGGGSQNRLLNQMAADACGLPVLAGPAEATALGNALMQAMGMGHFKSLAELRAQVAASFPPDTFEPMPSPAWDEAYARYQRLKEARIHARQ